MYSREKRMKTIKIHKEIQKTHCFSISPKSPVFVIPLAISIKRVGIHNLIRRLMNFALFYTCFLIDTFDYLNQFH